MGSHGARSHVGVRAEGSRGARTHGSMRGMGGGAGCVRGKG